MGRWFLRAGLPFIAFGSMVACGPPDPMVNTAYSATSGDPALGRQLFVQESCVVCHAVRGVGGRAAPALDVVEGDYERTPMDFVAAMWTGAPLMTELQELEIGYRIDLTGDDLRHLAAFGTSAAAQDDFTLNDVPVRMRDLFLSEVDLEEDLADRYIGEEWVDFSDRVPQDD
ncbi:MAG: cytochrome c [Pseudomonadota bacterium]